MMPAGGKGSERPRQFRAVRWRLYHADPSQSPQQLAYQSVQSQTPHGLYISVYTYTSIYYVFLQCSDVDL